MILIIDNYDSFVYNLYQVIAKYQTDIQVIRNDQITLADMTRIKPSGIVLSPGPGRPEEAGICIAAIREFTGKIPVLGVCLGHQAMACAFGGRVVNAGEIVHGKPATIFHHRNGLYKNLPLPFMAGRYHSLIVSRENLPTEFLIEAESPDGLIMGMRHRNHQTFGVQFHPESVLTPEGELLLKAFVDLTL